MKKSMKQRIVSGAVLVLFCAAVVVCNGIFPLALNLVVSLISAAAVYELIKALDLLKKWFLCLPALLTAAAVPFCPESLQFLVYCLFTALIFTSLLMYHHETSFREVAVLYSMTVLIPIALRTLIQLRDLNRDHGTYYVLIAVLSAWVADAGAYFVGTFFGKHQMCPEISPKKTVEGAVGGLVINVLILMASGLVMVQWLFPGQVAVNYLSLFLAGFLGTPISILGDLSFSLIKRSCHIKDFGQLIPGHGGILDRFDSVIFTAPFIYLLASYLPFLL